MSSALAPILAVYEHALQPIGALSWLGAPVSALDVLGAARLALVLRQLREGFHGEYLRGTADGDSSRRPGKGRTFAERRARARDIATTLVMVYGGEAVVAPWLGIQPSFMISGAIPATFVGVHALVELIPTVPAMSLYNEVPAALIDAFTRALLLCDFIPNVVTRHASPAVSNSPWTLLLTALITANAGPFFTSAFSLLHPTPINLTTPPELLPYGWTATDLWIAPLITGLYATLTHAQPFFTALHTLLYAFFAPVGLAHMSFQSLDKDGSGGAGSLAPVDADTARAVCVLVMSTLFLTRTVKNFGQGILWDKPSVTIRIPVESEKPAPKGSRSQGSKKPKMQ